VPVALVAIIYYLRPQRIPIATAIGVALFTAVIGIFMLLVLQSLADWVVHARRVPTGRGSIIWGIFAAIGAAYQAIHSDNVLVRWLGYVFGVGLCEEATKLLPLALLVIWRSDRHLSVHTFLFLGFVSGLGFGIGEAIYGYALWSSVYGVGDNIIRWYSAVPSHAIYTTVCAAFLWRLADQLESAESFWGRAMVIGMAVGVMALVHGTYNTVCSFGVGAALVMEVLSFVLLIWAVRWVTIDATEPPGLPSSAWAATLTGQKPIRMALGSAVVLLILAMTLGSRREFVMPAILRAELPSEERPYVDGVTVVRAVDGTALAIPLTVRFIFTPENFELVGRFTNRGPQALSKLIVTCYTKGENAEGKVIDLGELAAGATAEINDDRGWTFATGEHLTIQADGYAEQNLTLP
jgi:RsiW-degrading membrane proteinase PrsW (M82 family)